MMQLDNLFAKVEVIIDKYGRERSNLLPILTESQALVEHNYIPEELAEFIACGMCIPTSQVYEVITFYAVLSDTPRGRHIVQVCDSTVCRLNKNVSLVEALEDELGVKIGHTREDGNVTLEFTPCFGACDISPAIRIDQKVYGKL
ncbi:NADH-quinone oxidoreductase subunit E-like protein, partial [Aduncisulcus paluster]